jgi:hypothetical protein
MRTILYVFLALIFSATTAFAQISKTDSIKQQLLQTENKDTVAWTYNGIASLGFNQGFLHNWAAGGELGSIATNALFSGSVARLYHRHIWSNNLDMNYALFYAYSNNLVPRKTDDRIDFSSKYGYRLDTSKNFYLTGLFNFKSQFTKGYDYNAPNWDSFSTSKFLSPAYFILAAGIEYREGSNLQLFLSPVAARVTLVNDRYTLLNPEGAYGVAYGKTSRFEVGAYFSGRYQVNITKQLMYKTRVDLYSNYLAKNRTDSMGVVVKKDNPGNIDVLWDNLFSLSISKHFNVALSATVIYDNDIPYEKNYIDANGVETPKNEPGEGLGWIQLKQTFTLGIQYKF